MTAEDEVCFEESGSAEDNEFDAVVGALEEILLGEAFQKVQKGFCDEHCGRYRRLRLLISRRLSF